MLFVLLLLILRCFVCRLSFDFLFFFVPCNQRKVLHRGIFLCVQVLVQRISVVPNISPASYDIPSILSVISFAQSKKYKNPYIDATPNIPKSIE